MSFDEAVRLTEILLGFAFLQQSAEHLCGTAKERRLFLPRILLSILLILGIQTPWVLAGLVILGIRILKNFAGPYNGGSDRMGLLILCSLCLVHFLPSAHFQEAFFGYIAVQFILSYFIAGWVKIVNPDWRNGQALRDIFSFSVYPASEALRVWAYKPRTLLITSWAVMLFELSFPFTLVTNFTLIGGLLVAAAFHLMNAFLLGLNRFFWIWLAAYPSILWLQQRLFMS